MEQKAGWDQTEKKRSKVSRKKSSLTRFLTFWTTHLIIAEDDSFPLWKVALFLNFQIPLRTNMMMKMAMLRDWTLHDGKTKKKMNTQGTEKREVGHNKAESKGMKYNQTGLTLEQFKKQWSMVSFRSQEAQTSEGI